VVVGNVMKESFDINTVIDSHEDVLIKPPKEESNQSNKSSNLPENNAEEEKDNLDVNR